MTQHRSLTRIALGAVAAAALALPVMAQTPAATPLAHQAAPFAQPGDADTFDAGTDFDASFERFDELPDAPEPRGNVVDLDDIDPPVEIEKPPVPADTARAGRSLGAGIASYYGRKFHGRRTANGERFDMNAYTAAHKKLPFGSKVRVTNTRNGRSVVVRINDRGPFVRGRTIDLSRAAANEIGIISSGHGRVELALID